MEDLGKAVGVSAVTIFKWEKGKFFPKDTLLVKLAEVLGTSAEFLCSRDQQQAEGRGPVPATNDKNLKQVVLTARRQIANAASLPLESVRISLDGVDCGNTILLTEWPDKRDRSET